MKLDHKFIISIAELNILFDKGAIYLDPYVEKGKFKLTAFIDPDLVNFTSICFICHHHLAQSLKLSGYTEDHKVEFLIFYSVIDNRVIVDYSKFEYRVIDPAYLNSIERSFIVVKNPNLDYDDADDDEIILDDDSYLSFYEFKQICGDILLDFKISNHYCYEDSTDGKDIYVFCFFYNNLRNELTYIKELTSYPYLLSSNGNEQYLATISDVRAYLLNRGYLLESV